MWHCFQMEQSLILKVCDQFRGKWRRGSNVRSLEQFPGNDARRSVFSFPESGIDEATSEVQSSFREVLEVLSGH